MLHHSPFYVAHIIMTTALRTTRTLLFSFTNSSSSRRKGGRCSKSPSRAKGRGRIDAFRVRVKAAKEEDDDANNNGLRRRRNRTNKTDDYFDEETFGGKQHRQKMTFMRDDDDDDAEDNNNNSKDDDEFVLSNNVRRNKTAKEEEEEEEASIKERARTLKRRLQYEVLEEQRWREALKSNDISLKRGRIGKTYVQRRVQTHDLVRAKSGAGECEYVGRLRESHFLAKWKNEEGMCDE